jgi:SAM-dependent methyltransferase
MDVTSLLDFPDASFDMVNARFIMSFMWREAWPKLVEECIRVTRPGGIIRLTETDIPGVIGTSSVGLERINVLLARAFYRTGRSFHPDEDGNHLGLFAMLPQFLEQAGCHGIREQAHIINYSAGMEGYTGISRNWEVAMKLIQPFLIKLGLITPSEMDKLYQQMLDEFARESFRGIWFFMSAYGQTPV